MRYYTFFLLIVFCSCKTLQVAENKNIKNTPSIGIEWNYSEKVNDKLLPKIDSVILKGINTFNSEKHSFSVHKKKPKDKDYLSLSFDKGKIVGGGEKAAGYIISTLGLIVAPAVLIGADAGFIVVFYFWPTHKIQGVMDLSPSMAADKGSIKRLYLETGALFSKNSKQVEKLLEKFSKAFYSSLIKIETQISSH